MPKGEGLPRGRRLGADLLEGRRLLTHIGSLTGSHVITTTPVQVAPLPTTTHTEPETGRTTTNVGDVEAREAEGVAAATAAASVVSKESVTIPLITPGKTLEGPEGMESSAQGSSDSSRFLRTTYRDEPIAWGMGAGMANGTGLMAHHWSDTTLPAPEFNTQITDGVGVEPHSIHPAASEPIQGLAPSQGSDLLDEFLPSDRVSLEQAIDRLLDGLEGIGVNLAEGIEGHDSLSSPLAWGISIASLEVIRRRLRKSSAEEEDATDPDRDPAVGFLDFPA